MAEERRKLDPVVTGVTKKSSSQKDNFFANGLKDVGRSIVSDLLVPAVKDIISNTISYGVDRLLFGDSSHRPTSGYFAPQKTSYSSYWSGTSSSNVIDYRQAKTAVLSSAYNYDDIVFNNLGQAREVLRRLEMTLAEYKAVSVSQFYDICGVQSNYTDIKYGWFSFEGTTIQRSGSGYILRLPKAELLD